MPDQEALLVASLLAQKLPADLTRFAMAAAVSSSTELSGLEPWIRLEEVGRTIEVHIREGGDVELHVYVPGRRGDPRESLFICEDEDFESFTDYLAESFNVLVSRLS